MAVLWRLIEAEGRVVSKEELIAAAWNGGIVSDHSVANAVSDLRRALGDDSREPRYIETIPKRGYRLAAPVERADDGALPAAPDSRSLRRRWVWALAATAAGATIVAALILWVPPRSEPGARLFLADIDNATGQSEWDLAAAATAEMLSVALAGGDYRLIRWRAGPFEDPRTRTLSEGTSILAKHDRMLVARIVQDGETPLLALRLVDGADGASIWGASYLLDEMPHGGLAERIVADLREPLGLSGARPVYASANPAILEAYWRARYLWSLRETGAIREAHRLLRDIVEDAPRYAPAHAALADIYAHKTAEELGLPRVETYALAERHLSRALVLAPELSEAFVSRAYLSFFRDGNSTAATAQVERAIAARPGLTALAHAAQEHRDYLESAVPLAALQAGTGQRDAAVGSLLGDPPREKSWWWSWYAVMPAFDAVRDDPRLVDVAPVN